MIFYFFFYFFQKFFMMTDKKEDKKETIVTHDGQFHPDEVFAVAIVNKIFGYNIVRTRNPEIIRQGTVVIDIGKIYDPKQLRYDHHQTNFNEYYDKRSFTKMSSAGLIFKHYGKEIVGKMINDDNNLLKIHDLNPFLSTLYHEIFEEVDAVDNGIFPVYQSKFVVHTSIPQIVSKMNSFNVYDDEEQMKQFAKAIELVMNLLQILIKNFYIHEIAYDEDYKLIEKAMGARIIKGDNKDDKNRYLNYIVVSNMCVNWKKCVKDYEKKHSDEKPNILYVIGFVGKEWRVHTVKERQLIADEAIIRKKITHLSDLIFVHKGRFIAGAKTLETAIEIVRCS